MTDQHTLTQHAPRIAATQQIWMNDAGKQADSLALWGHDAAWIGATAWAKAARQLLGWPNHWHPEHQMDTPDQIRVLIKHLPTAPPGLRNQVEQGLRLRAGLVVGAPRKCPRTGCPGLVMPGTIRCDQCSAGLDGIDGVDRCRNQLCLAILEPGKSRRGLCDNCRKHEDRTGEQRNPKTECQHPRVYVTSGTHGTCTACGATLER